MHGFSDHAGSNDGSRKRRHRYRLPPLSTASAPQTSPFSRLNSRPACTPVNASLHPHGTPTHDSGPPRIATPSMQRPFISISMPVYPGAFRNGASGRSVSVVTERADNDLRAEVVDAAGDTRPRAPLEGGTTASRQRATEERPVGLRG